MRWRLAKWFLAGFAVAVAMGAIGTLLGVRRGVMLADEEATISLPTEEEAPASTR
jgi:ABC-type Mn2+/Zn2+ transport system permease subunit